MAIRPVLRMGDPRLLVPAEPVREFGTPELEALLQDMHDTMEALDGAGLAAPQIGVGLQVVIFGVKRNPRYPDAEEVPYTVLVNPELLPVQPEMEEGWEGCLSRAGHARSGAAVRRVALSGFRPERHGHRSHGLGFPRPRRAARGRSSARHPLPDAHTRPAAISDSMRCCSRARTCRTSGRRLSPLRTSSAVPAAQTSSRSVVLASRSACPVTRKVSSARSPRVLIFAV